MLKKENCSRVPLVGDTSPWMAFPHKTQLPDHQFSIQCESQGTAQHWKRLSTPEEGRWGWTTGPGPDCERSRITQKVSFTALPKLRYWRQCPPTQYLGGCQLGGWPQEPWTPDVLDTLGLWKCFWSQRWQWEKEIPPSFTWIPFLNEAIATRSTRND